MNAMQDSTTSHTEQGRPEQAPPNVQAPPTAQAPPYAQAPPAPQVRMRDPRSKSAVVAAILSCMPGLGQVYVGYYQRGFIHAIVVAGLITLLAGRMVGQLIPLFALFMAFFWLYNIIDAARRATHYNEALAGNPAFDMPEDLKMPKTGGSIFGGACLIGIGFILLLHTRFDMSLDWMEEWWPVAPMIFGGYLLVRAIQDRQEKQSAGESEQKENG